MLLVRAVNGARGLLIARWVGPRAVGVFAAVIAFVTVANLLADLGLSSYLVSRGRRAADEAKAVFQIAMGMAIVGSVSLILLSGRLASLYDAPQARAVTCALTGSVVLAGLAVVPNALLRTEMRFRDVARAQVAGELASLLVGVGLAMGGAEIWALVASLLASQATALFFVVRARPSWPRGAAVAQQARKRALRYGLTVAAGSLLWTVALQGDNVTVGRLLGTTALGFYGFAYTYGILPGATVGSMIADVALASFSREETTEGRRRLFLRFTTVGAAIGTPIAAIGFALAPAAIRCVLGERWLPASRPLQVLLVVGWIRGLFPSVTLLRATGRVGVEVRIGFVAAPLTVFAAIVGAHRGITDVSALVAAVLIGSSLTATIIGARGVAASGAEVVRAVAVPAILAVAAAGGAWVGAHFATPGATILVIGPTALLVYVAGLRLLAPNLWSELWDIFAANRPSHPVDSGDDVARNNPMPTSVPPTGPGPE